ncbi:S1 family peptidase [Streptomyces sp. NRRL WC-3742]|uniref:S1 family peptidase n=1 Tax=Streptomyces sp. NRRL WC-3742 TaxID=1463934 RepID=UPI00131CE463|nr:serine protease [Streptomyces sp. NRRL WC-3742]
MQVRVTRQGNAGRAAFATGYLVAPRLVLTTAHVLGSGPRPDVGGVTICRPSSSEKRFAARVLWQRGDGTIDAALVEVEQDIDWPVPASLTGPDTRPPQRWGQLIGSRPQPVTVCGYPRMQKDVTGRGDEQLTGHIHPGTGRLANRYEILSTNPALPYDAPPGSTATKWSGLSGAAVICGDLLVGLVSQDRQAPTGSRLTAVRAGDLLADHGFRTVIARHTGWPPLLEPVEPAGLLAPAARARDLRSPAMLLRADTEAVGFQGRERELRDLLDWCREGPEDFAVRVLTGPGGQGKSRLARHVTAILREAGWVAAQLRADMADAPGDTGPDWSLLDTSLPLLLVVDYAETLPHQLRRLIEHLRHARHRTRLLLIARGKGEWMSDTLGAGPDTRAILATAPITLLGPLLPRDASPEARAAAFAGATRDLAGLLAHVPGLPRADWPAIAARTGAPGSLNGARHISALSLQMTALVTLLQHGPDPVGSAPGQDVEALLLSHEARYWEGTAASPMFRLGDVRPATLRRAVAVAALCGAATQAEALTTTLAVPGLPPGREWDVAEWLRALYPPSTGRYWGSLQPDRLAEYHATAELTHPGPEFLTTLWRIAGDNQQLRAFVVLARATSAHASARRTAAVSEILDALNAALDTGRTSHRVMRAAAAMIPSSPKHPLSAISRRLHLDIVASFRALAAANPGDHETETELALALNDLAADQYRDGGSTEAQRTFEEALAIVRRHAPTNPGFAERTLATVLHNLFILYSRTGRPEALASLKETIAVERRLARTDPTTDASYLALALYDLSLRLGRSRPEDSVKAAQESVGIYRRLARSNPAYGPSLGRALYLLHIQLDDLGRQEESEAALGEYREVTDRAGALPIGSPPQAGLRRRINRRPA